ncbi:putative membrane protein [Escherichia coli 2731150]|nr:putative membrane protein [Escherichia coli 2762100]EMW74247.1 putative membrane protein [Escherichia coli 2731150]
MLQEIDDMQAKIVIYLRIIIQFIKFNYLCTMFLSTLPWC